MAGKKYVLRFPARLVDQPIASRLARDFDLTVNILRARVEPDEEGMLVVELSGKPQGVKSALDYARNLGVEVETLEKKIAWHQHLCTECTACRSVCPTGALTTDGEAMAVSFHQERCIACELCIPVCPYRAVEISV
jgi:ferredoxin